MDKMVILTRVLSIRKEITNITELINIGDIKKALAQLEDIDSRLDDIEMYLDD